jgi:hypothetical protein
MTDLGYVRKLPRKKLWRKRRKVSKAGKVAAAIIILLALAGSIFYVYMQTQPNDMATIKATIYYADGSSRVIDPRNSFELMWTNQFTLIDPVQPSEPIDRIEYAVEVRVSWTGILQGVSFSGNVKTNMRHAPTTYIVNTNTLSQPSPSQSGQWLTIHTKTVTASEMNSICQAAGLRDTEVYLDIVVTVTATATFKTESGTVSDSKSGSTSLSFKMLYEEPTLDPLELRITSNPLY